MNTTKIALFAGAAVVVAGGLVLAIKMNPTTSTKDGKGAIGAPAPVEGVANRVNPQIDDLSPITHVAMIPASVDPSTIHFDRLKTVELASKTKTTTDIQNCKERQAREPDGSNCEATAVVARVKAIEALYSYNGPEVSSGESSPGHVEFVVYFRPEELAIDGPVEKLKHDQAAALFQVHTTRSTVQQQVIDKQNSKFCAGSYIDGNWTPKDPQCHDQVQYTTQTVLSPYLTVQVDVLHPATMASRLHPDR
jgi:hypothetical protein